MVGGGSTMAARLGLSPLEVAAWTAIGDAGIISGSDIVKPQHKNLVSRMLRANAALATAGEASADFSDNATLIDVSRARIPHSRPTMRYRFFRAMSVYSHSVITATQVFCAAFIAITIGVALGFDRPDWAVVSVLLILQWGPDRILGSIRGVHRFLGTIAGIAIFIDLHAWGIHSLSLLLVLCFCQYMAEI